MRRPLVGQGKVEKEEPYMQSEYAHKTNNLLGKL
jgi:hypothetical protein